MSKRIRIFTFLMLFLACEELPFSGEDISSDNQIPATTPIETESVFYSPDVTINWTGNEFAFAYNYRLESLSYANHVDTYSNWSDWSADTFATLNNLDEGNYTFYVKSRFSSEIEESVPQSLSFEIDAITTPGLRIYPLHQEVQVSNTFEVYLYAENIDDLAGSKIELQFDTDQIDYIESSENCGFESDIFCPQLNDSIITIINWNINGGFETDSQLVQLSFSALNEGVTDILIYSSILRNSLNTDISSNDPVNGRIGIIP